MERRHRKGRGSISNDNSRFVELSVEAVDDGWYQEDDALTKSVNTEIFVDKSKTILTRNKSPDVPFNISINPYKGCEHGCAYCFARPTHAYLDLSPGLDFETKIFAKPDAAELLKKELESQRYQPQVIALGANTDAYQPIERTLKITRSILEVLREYRNPVTIITKSAMVERDMDILRELAQQNLVKIVISVTTLDNELSRRLEPRAAAPQRRLRTIRNLNENKIPVGILFAPVIPMLNDNEMENILKQTTQAGSRSAGYVLLRLPHELKQLFQEWLETHYPLKARRVMNIIRETRDGREYNSQFHTRQTGEGVFADLFWQRFSLAAEKLSLLNDNLELTTGLFTRSTKFNKQLNLFD